MMIVLRSCFQIRRWRLSSNTNECHILPCIFIVNNNTEFRRRYFNITHFILTQKCIPFVLFDINWCIYIDYLLTYKTTCSHYREETHSSSLNNSHKLPIPLSDMLYQYDGGFKFSINLINDTKALRALKMSI